jgi:hypothetical protein
VRRLLLALTVVLVGGVACSDGGGGAAATSSTSLAVTTTVVPPSAGDLSDPYACGFGVALGNPAQTTGLFVHVDYERTSIDDVPTEGGRIGDGEWVGELRRGSDLFANWCTDVIVDPQAIEEETVSVTGGTIELVGASADLACGDPITVELRDLQLADGQTLPDATFDAEGWGCFAG